MQWRYQSRRGSGEAVAGRWEEWPMQATFGHHCQGSWFLSSCSSLLFPFFFLSFFPLFCGQTSWGEPTLSDIHAPFVLFYIDVIASSSLATLSDTLAPFVTFVLFYIAIQTDSRISDLITFYASWRPHDRAYERARKHVYRRGVVPTGKVNMIERMKRPPRNLDKGFIVTAAYRTEYIPQPTHNHHLLPAFSGCRRVIQKCSFTCAYRLHSLVIILVCILYSHIHAVHTFTGLLHYCYSSCILVRSLDPLITGYKEHSEVRGTSSES